MAADSPDTVLSAVPAPTGLRKNPYALFPQAYVCVASRAWSLCLVWEPSCFPANYQAAEEYGYQEPFLPAWALPYSAGLRRSEAHGAFFHFPEKAVLL